jgi:hypothetical protein
MVAQIISCLKRSRAKYVFFCEHDVLYHQDHFTFDPPKDDIFYYNENVLRWMFGADTVVVYDRMIPLSVMCANREFALDHYLRRQQYILEKGLDKIKSKEPAWVRQMGYEPGTKKKRRGGFSDDDYGTWFSRTPVIDIRHKNTFSRPKVSLSEFKHPPEHWTEIPVADIMGGWDLWRINAT